MRNLFSITLMVAILALFAACTNQADSNKTAPKDAAIEKTRSMNSAKAIDHKKIMGYTSLAQFSKGEYSGTMNLEDLGKLEGKNVNLVVLYDTEAPWANLFNNGDVSKTGDENFNELMNIYNLSIIKQFELDEMNEGLVLEPNGNIGDPVKAARDISMIDYVLMVHVKEVPTEEPNETADND